MIDAASDQISLGRRPEAPRIADRPPPAEERREFRVRVVQRIELPFRVGRIIDVLV